VTRFTIFDTDDIFRFKLISDLSRYKDQDKKYEFKLRYNTLKMKVLSVAKNLVSKMMVGLGLKNGPSILIPALSEQVNKAG
jgi:hypothetical protein